MKIYACKETQIHVKTQIKKQIRMSDSNTGILGKSPNICSD